jgi:peptide deformylase
MSEIFQVGSKVIRQKAKKVKFPLKLDDKNTIKKMESSLDGLVGISAPQVGDSKRIFIVYLRNTDKRMGLNGEKELFINPEITRYSRKKVLGWEGCGSFACAGIFGQVPRCGNIDIEFFDIKGNKKKKTVDGFEAVVIQHELDHLEGKIFIDRVLDTKSLMSEQEYKKMINKKNKKK